jgi:hypothetical protein
MPRKKEQLQFSNFLEGSLDLTGRKGGMSYTLFAAEL